MEEIKQRLRDLMSASIMSRQCLRLRDRDPLLMNALDDAASITMLIGTRKVWSGFIGCDRWEIEVRNGEA